jgi:hypothetical protein
MALLSKVRHWPGVEEWTTALPASLWVVMCRVTGGRGEIWSVLDILMVWYEDAVKGELRWEKSYLSLFLVLRSIHGFFNNKSLCNVISGRSSLVFGC